METGTTGLDTVLVVTTRMASLSVRNGEYVTVTLLLRLTEVGHARARLRNF